MFTTTLSMWLGILFLGLGITAVLLQAWLWGPKFWDEEAKKTRAPSGPPRSMCTSPPALWA